MMIMMIMIMTMTKIMVTLICEGMSQFAAGLSPSSVYDIDVSLTPYVHLSQKLLMVIVANMVNIGDDDDNDDYDVCDPLSSPDG